MEVERFSVITERTDTKPIQLILHQDGLTVTQDGEEKRRFDLEDVIGLKVADQSSSSPETYCPVELCTFSVTEKSPKTKRKMKFVYFFFNCGNSFEENRAAAMACNSSIQRQCRRNDRNIFANTTTSSDVSSIPEEVEDYPTPRLLIVINPFSGTKRGLKDYRDSVEPLFEIAGIVTEETLITERPNHAKEFIQSFDFSRITGIVCVGGDGTLFELINGMMNRRDHDDVMTTPIGVIPTGSGNGVLSSLLYEQSEEYCISSAVHQIIRGGIQSIDLAKVTMATKQFYMFLSLTWGIIADIDVESETFRFLGGELRTTIGAAKCILQKRIYRGRLSYIPANTAGKSIPANTAGNHHESTEVEHESAHQENQGGRGQIPNGKTQQNGSTSNGIHVDTSNTRDSSPAILNETTPTKNDDDASDMATGGLTSVTDSLTTYDDSNWITLEDDYVTVLIGLAPMISNTLFGNPRAVLGRGHMYIMHARREAKRMELLNAMIAMETGEHINHDIVTIIEAAKACRLQPLTDAGRIVIDGEEVDYGHVHMEMGGAMTVYSRKRRDQQN